MDLSDPDARRFPPQRPRGENNHQANNICPREIPASRGETSRYKPDVQVFYPTRQSKFISSPGIDRKIRAKMERNEGIKGFLARIKFPVLQSFCFLEKGLFFTRYFNWKA